MTVSLCEGPESGLFKELNDRFQALEFGFRVSGFRNEAVRF